MLLQETNFRSKDTQTESGGWKKVCNANGNEKKAGVAILISNKIDFRTKTVTRDKKEHYKMTKKSNQEDITIVNIHAPNIGAPKYKMQILTYIRGEMHGNTVIVEDFNTR